MQIQRHDVKILSMVLGGAIGLVLFIISSVQLLEFTDSTAFCGRLCHAVMYPEYTAHKASPHSNVLCADCHVGPGASYLVKSKVSGTRMIINTITGDYERPITVPVLNLRPARETCERCHRPENFSGDLVRVHVSFASDQANTGKVDTRVLRVGGGRLTSARGIHWHISAKVYYLALDEKLQEIGWVGVDRGNGVVAEFVDPNRAGEITPQRIKEEQRLMDCIDCHNRATHIYNSPNKLIDTALNNGDIDKTLPFIKREGLKTLDPPNSSLEAANAKIDALRDFYRQNYPQISQGKAQSIESSITELKHIAVITTFPEMKVTWDSYPSNVGHLESPGCFRCHGKVVNSTGGVKGQLISNDCQLCHYLDIKDAFKQ